MNFSIPCGSGSLFANSRDGFIFNSKYTFRISDFGLRN